MCRNCALCSNDQGNFSRQKNWEWVPVYFQQVNVHFDFLPKPSNGSTFSYNTKEEEIDKFFTTQLQSWCDSYPKKPAAGVTTCSFYEDAALRKAQQPNVSCFVQNNIYCPIRSSFFNGRPSIILTLNSSFGWEPHGFDLNGTQYNPARFDEIFYSDVRELKELAERRPERGLKAMPETLQTDIRRRLTESHSIMWKTNFLNSVFVTCEEVTPVGKYLEYKINFHTDKLFPSYYFPFTNQPGYKTPFILIDLLPMRRVLVDIECRAWAKNIHHDREGVVRFQVLVENDWVTK